MLHKKKGLKEFAFAVNCLVDWNNSVGVLEVKFREKSPLTQAANNFNYIVD